MLVGMLGSPLGVRECVHLAGGYFGNVQLLNPKPYTKKHRLCGVDQSPVI